MAPTVAAREWTSRQPGSIYNTHGATGHSQSFGLLPEPACTRLRLGLTWPAGARVNVGKSASRHGRAGQRDESRLASERSLELPPPPELEAHALSVGEDEYTLFVFPLPAPQPPPGLTPAEREVASAVSQGQSNAEIARARGTSPNTIANQLRSIYAKVEAAGRIELIERCTSQAGLHGRATR